MILIYFHMYIKRYVTLRVTALPSGSLRSPPLYLPEPVFELVANGREAEHKMQIVPDLIKI